MKISENNSFLCKTWHDVEVFYRESVPDMKKALRIVVAVVICFAVGGVARWVQADALANWYPLLDKPSIMPPNRVFPIAWTIIYACMGVSVGLILPARSKRRRALKKIFGIQLALNFLWSVSFFYMESPFLGMVNIIALAYVVMLYMEKAYKVNRASMWLFVPYALWLIFAIYLNGYIYYAN